MKKGGKKILSQTIFSFSLKLQRNKDLKILIMKLGGKYIIIKY